ncbi:cyclin N-terminal domain-containing protein 1 isoform X2 [Leucoraja erinacea]|uniref:cyclin N-terminal domain-containing protein 1 isoform X2 n=1 Tax=Leucoraja erinaceus TaxID=7782 RepID=UPI00245859EF|nr:cyclin N-terminal domain-containing protein 1 isoform X2 [Leucoraja erinacea]
MMMMTTRVVVVRVDESRACGPQTPELAFVAASPEMLEEFLVDVAKENENHLLKLPQHAGSFKKLRLIEFVFLLCEQLGLHHVTRYQAVEILDRFMIQYIDKLYSSTCPGSDKDTEKNDWTLTQITIQEHFVLRIMSCVQIASKISFHYQIVNNDMALKFLQSLGYSYKREDLLDSELLVLKTLNFQVNVPTPFTHTEILLEVMGYNDPSVPVKYLHSISLKVLTFVYLMRNTIYENLLKIAIENSTPTDLQRAKFLSVKEDCMLLAVGVIGTSAFILNYTPWCKVVQQLASISGVTEESISEFSQVILKQIFPGASHLK